MSNNIAEAVSPPLMADVFSKAKRSKVMAAIRSRGNRDTELKLMAILRVHGITGWRREQRLLGKPDFVFRRERLAVFVDGCFWHGCAYHFRMPHSNRNYWKRKIARNKSRDKLVAQKLKSQGWMVVRVWQHQLGDERKLIGRIRSALVRKSRD